jgi:hypothetical protein
MFRIFTLLLLVSFMTSCSEEQDVRLNQLEEKFSIQLQLINIEYARHHLDYGVVYIKLHNSPGNEFWSSLESHGWEKDADSSTISYSREGYRLEYINAEQLIVIIPLRSKTAPMVYRVKNKRSTKCPTQAST